MNIVRLPVHAIDPGDRLRPVDPDHAQVIAAAMEADGQLAPIVVRPRKGKGALQHLLVAGAHRLMAAQTLGWAEIDAVLFEGSADEARLAEIDENLIRHELNVVDRAAFLAERKRLYEKLHPETKHGGDRKSEAIKMVLPQTWCC